mmetsp:Transcript_36636/g.93341  ORF Transcript_36636/g.93341 Transcript_36636/m.93341 type:complete len:326 (+) Transcript_36636:1179-2156(+)
MNRAMESDAALAAVMAAAQVWLRAIRCQYEMRFGARGPQGLFWHAGGPSREEVVSSTRRRYSSREVPACQHLPNLLDSSRRFAHRSQCHRTDLHRPHPRGTGLLLVNADHDVLQCARPLLLGMDSNAQHLLSLPQGLKIPLQRFLKAPLGTQLLVHILSDNNLMLVLSVALQIPCQLMHTRISQAHQTAQVVSLVSCPQQIVLPPLGLTGCRSCDLNTQRGAAFRQRLAIESQGALEGGVIIEVHESEAPTLVGLVVDDQLHIFHFATPVGEEMTKVVFFGDSTGMALYAAFPQVGNCDAVDRPTVPRAWRQHGMKTITRNRCLD